MKKWTIINPITVFIPYLLYSQNRPRLRSQKPCCDFSPLNADSVEIQRPKPFFLKFYNAQQLTQIFEIWVQWKTIIWCLLVTMVHQKLSGMLENLLFDVPCSAKKTALLKRITPMKRKRKSCPSSFDDTTKVFPRICRPFECLDSLKTRRTRTSLMTRSAAREVTNVRLL